MLVTNHFWQITCDMQIARDFLIQANCNERLRMHCLQHSIFITLSKNESRRWKTEHSMQNIYDRRIKSEGIKLKTEYKRQKIVKRGVSAEGRVQ